MKTELILYAIGAVLAYQYAKKQGILPSMPAPTITVTIPTVKSTAPKPTPTGPLW